MKLPSVDSVDTLSLGAMRRLVAGLVGKMNMKVQSWAPPFGMIEHPPKRMCDLLTYIVGANSADDQAFPYCADVKIPYDQ
ncbi:hypothetical protein [Phyllobacterium zundukense]|uniref:Uncharacterized protein n=1 Tax=Phyllobacterium zundukense TaxID=1867719 RepID=A0ACD4CXB9_9HYPH|nr:hypothetical protein [Phyllobacterium zundukense]UXN58098.1 hypothetical protein N8E88_07430 [Phyllobacterium zundukense]